MINYNHFEITTKTGSVYENTIEYGSECEWLDGVALKNGCFCKHYSKKRDWKGISLVADVKDANGLPVEQHYCLKDKLFMGFSYCCYSTLSCFEEGKSAGVKRLLNKIRKIRGYIE